MKSAVGVDVTGIPQALRDRAQWVGWKWEMREKGPTKVPVCIRTGKLASSTNPSTWTTFEEASARLSRGPGLDGIGYVFSANDDFIGIDFDKCLDAGQLKPWAAPLVEMLDSYTEITPSGTGLHVIVRGKIPGDRHKGGYGDGSVEVYTEGRYFTVTGQRWAGTAAEPLFRQEQFEAFYSLMFPAKVEKPAPARVKAHPTLDDRELLEKMFAAENGRQIEALWKGGLCGFISDSEARLALLDHLAWWTAGDAVRIDRLFRQSGRKQEKYERLKEKELAIAIASGGKGYSQNGSSAPVTSDSDPTSVAEDTITLPIFYTAAELQYKALPECEWAVPGYIPEGCTMLTAHSKIGKTFLAEDAAVAVAMGGRAWGKIEVRQGRVVYLDTEGNERRVQKRLNNLLGDEPWPENLLLSHELITLDRAGFVMLDKICELHAPLRMLVLDPYNAIRPFRGKAGDLVKEDYIVIRALRDIGRKWHCAILLLHHSSLNPKSDTVNSGAGTHGLAAAASVVLNAQRVRGENDATIAITGNDIELERTDHFHRMENGFWVLQGSGEEFMENKHQQDIFDLIQAQGALGPSTAAKALGRTVDSVKKMMRRMSFKGLLIVDDGKYSIPQVRN